jgi:DNA-binding protein WhiA
VASFASEVRRQISSSAPASSGEKIALLAGLIDASGDIDGDTLSFRTTSAPVARLAVRLLLSGFGLDARLSRRVPARDRFGRLRYTVEAAGNRAVQAAEELRIASRTLNSPHLKNAYLCGSFAAAGSVTRPTAECHLEFVHRDGDFIRRVSDLSKARLKTTRRRGRWVAYAKSAEEVTTLLSQIGLHDAVLEYEARAVLGEAKANANRTTNFDSANASRTAASASRQKAALESLDPERLPHALRDMRGLRLEHPHATLSELAHLGGISKSAANHRLRRLVKLTT